MVKTAVCLYMYSVHVLGFSLDSGIVDFLVFSHFLSYKTAAISHLKKSLGILFAADPGDQGPDGFWQIQGFTSWSK